MQDEAYFTTLASLWSQETEGRHGGNADLDLRRDNFLFVKTIGNCYQECSERVLIL